MKSLLGSVALIAMGVSVRRARRGHGGKGTAFARLHSAVQLVWALSGRQHRRRVFQRHRERCRHDLDQALPNSSAVSKSVTIGSSVTFWLALRETLIGQYLADRTSPGGTPLGPVQASADSKLDQYARRTLWNYVRQMAVLRQGRRRLGRRPGIVEFAQRNEQDGFKY